MITTLPRRIAPAPSSSPATGRVSDELLSSLRQHGMDCPVRGLGDPRLEYPELLLIAGWDRVEIDGGYQYRLIVEDSPSTHERWEQCYEVRNDDTRLVTRAGRRVQTLQESADGRVTSASGLAED